MPLETTKHPFYSTSSLGRRPATSSSRWRTTSSPLSGSGSLYISNHAIPGLDTSCAYEPSPLSSLSMYLPPRSPTPSSSAARSLRSSEISASRAYRTSQESPSFPRRNLYSRTVTKSSLDLPDRSYLSQDSALRPAASESIKHHNFGYYSYTASKSNSAYTRSLATDIGTSTSSTNSASSYSTRTPTYSSYGTTFRSSYRPIVIDRPSIANYVPRPNEERAKMPGRAIRRDRPLIKFLEREDLNPAKVRHLLNAWARGEALEEEEAVEEERENGKRDSVRSNDSGIGSFRNSRRSRQKSGEPNIEVCHECNTTFRGGKENHTNASSVDEGVHLETEDTFQVSTETILLTCPSKDSTDVCSRSISVEEDSNNVAIQNSFENIAVHDIPHSKRRVRINADKYVISFDAKGKVADENNNNLAAQNLNSTSRSDENNFLSNKDECKSEALIPSPISAIDVPEEEKRQTEKVKPISLSDKVALKHRKAKTNLTAMVESKPKTSDKTREKPLSKIEQDIVKVDVSRETKSVPNEQTAIPEIEKNGAVAETKVSPEHKTIEIVATKNKKAITFEENTSVVNKTVHVETRAAKQIEQSESATSKVKATGNKTPRQPEEEKDTKLTKQQTNEDKKIKFIKVKVSTEKCSAAPLKEEKAPSKEQALAQQQEKISKRVPNKSSPPDSAKPETPGERKDVFDPGIRMNKKITDQEVKSNAKATLFRSKECVANKEKEDLKYKIGNLVAEKVISEEIDPYSNSKLVKNDPTIELSPAAPAEGERENSGGKKSQNLIKGEFFVRNEKEKDTEAPAHNSLVITTATPTSAAGRAEPIVRSSLISRKAVSDKSKPSAPDQEALKLQKSSSAGIVKITTAREKSDNLNFVSKNLESKTGFQPTAETEPPEIKNTNISVVKTKIEDKISNKGRRSTATDFPTFQPGEVPHQLQKSYTTDCNSIKKKMASNDGKSYKPPIPVPPAQKIEKSNKSKENRNIKLKAQKEEIMGKQNSTEVIPTPAKNYLPLENHVDAPLPDADSLKNATGASFDEAKSKDEQKSLSGNKIAPKSEPANELKSSDGKAVDAQISSDLQHNLLSDDVNPSPEEQIKLDEKCAIINSTASKEIAELTNGYTVLCGQTEYRSKSEDKALDLSEKKENDQNTVADSAPTALPFISESISEEQKPKKEKKEQNKDFKRKSDQIHAPSNEIKTLPGTKKPNAITVETSITGREASNASLDNTKSLPISSDASKKSKLGTGKPKKPKTKNITTTGTAETVENLVCSKDGKVVDNNKAKAEIKPILTDESVLLTAAKAEIETSGIILQQHEKTTIFPDCHEKSNLRKDTEKTVDVIKKKKDKRHHEPKLEKEHSSAAKSKLGSNAIQESKKGYSGDLEEWKTRLLDDEELYLPQSEGNQFKNAFGVEYSAGCTGFSDQTEMKQKTADVGSLGITGRKKIASRKSEKKNAAQISQKQVEDFEDDITEKGAYAIDYALPQQAKHVPYNLTEYVPQFCDLSALSYLNESFEAVCIEDNYEPYAFTSEIPKQDDLKVGKSAGKKKVKTEGEDGKPKKTKKKKIPRTGIEEKGDVLENIGSAVAENCTGQLWQTVVEEARPAEPWNPFEEILAEGRERELRRQGVTIASRVNLEEVWNDYFGVAAEFPSNFWKPKEGRAKRNFEIEEFNLLKVLGRGSYGKVMLAQIKDNKQYVAIKCLKKHVVVKDNDVECTLIEREVLCMVMCHPYLCTLFCTFQNETHLFFVMEYLSGGDLMFHIQKSGKFEEDRTRFYAAEIICALKYLHSYGIIYRDAKLDNICLDAEGHIRLVDFGFCKLKIRSKECLPRNMCGTPDYMAPEIIRGNHYNQSVDWWSFAVLFYEMLIGQSPFSGKSETDLFWSTCHDNVQYPSFISAESRQLMILLFEREPERRLGMPGCEAGDICAQPFFQGIDWRRVERKQLEPPFRPNLESEGDVSNFDSDFTDERAVLTPITERILPADQEFFLGFSYTNPDIFARK